MRSKENWMIHFRKSKAKVFHCFQTPSWVQFLSITLKGITKIPLYKCFSYYSMNMISTGCDCLNNPIDGTNNTPFSIILTCPLYSKWCKMPLFFLLSLFIIYDWILIYAFDNDCFYYQAKRYQSILSVSKVWMIINWTNWNSQYCKILIQN